MGWNRHVGIVTILQPPWTRSMNINASGGNFKSTLLKLIVLVKQVHKNTAIVKRRRLSA